MDGKEIEKMIKGFIMKKNKEEQEYMLIPYMTVIQAGEDEIIEKKSKFIAHVMPVETEAEALQFIEEQKKKYWDARHNCYAFIVGKKGETLRFSDDGEPQGTAGKPILEVLQKLELRNVVVVVTRYFGGVLLGTGGLVRAYTQSTKAGIEAAGICEMTPMSKITADIDYSLWGKIKYVLVQWDAVVIKEEYEVSVKLTFAISLEKKEGLLKELVEATNGQTIFEEAEGEILWTKLEK